MFDLGCPCTSAMDRHHPLALHQLLELLQAVVLLQVWSMLSLP